MLRCMLRDSESASHSRNERANPDEPFFRALRKLRERYAGRSISTRELVQVFEEELPRPLWYENRRSLDWFLEGWIKGTAVPRLEAREVKITQQERGMKASGTISTKGRSRRPGHGGSGVRGDGRECYGFSGRNPGGWP